MNYGTKCFANCFAARYRGPTPAADFPVAVAAGRGGAVGMFKPTGDTLAWTFLAPASEQFTRSTPVPDRRTDSPPGSRRT